jgi:hypothetical protein
MAENPSKIKANEKFSRYISQREREFNFLLLLYYYLWPVFLLPLFSLNLLPATARHLPAIRLPVFRHLPAICPPSFAPPNQLVLLILTVSLTPVFERLPAIFLARTRGSAQMPISIMFPVGYAVFGCILRVCLASGAARRICA